MKRVVNQTFNLTIFSILTVLAIASFFRFYQIGQVPPGLFGDEATHALDALDVLDGTFTLYTPGEGSTGTLWRYLLALNFAVFGASIFTLRAFAGAVGVQSVLMTYFVVKELALTPSRSLPNDTSNRWPKTIAIVASLLLATSYWHVELSRIAFSAILMLLAQDLAFFFLWRALASGRRLWFICFGLSLGLMAYHYLPGKLVPAVPLLFFLLEWLISRKKALLIKYWRSLLIAAGLAFAVALPLALFVLFNFETVADRAMLPTGAVVSLSPLQAILASLTRFGLWPTLWLSARWNSFFLGPLLTLCFVTGVITSLIRFKKPNYLFLLVWWGVMMLPGVLASEGIPPHARRAIGAATPTFALAALGLAALVFVLFRLIQTITRSSRSYTTAPLITAILLGIALAAWTGNNTFNQYFLDWGTSNQARLDYHVYDLELAEIMAHETGAETVYLLPLDSSAGIINPVLDNITFVYNGQSTFNFLPDDEQTLPATLANLIKDKQQVRLLRWKVSKHTGADPKHVAHYYLERWGDFVESKSYQYFDIDTYHITNKPHPLDQASLQPENVSFEDQLALTGYAFGPESGQNENLAGVLAGDLMWAELAWQKISNTNSNYQVGLWLEDEAGHIVGRADKLLLSNITHQSTGQWPQGAAERDYYLLPVNPTTPPGSYWLKAVLYQSDDGKRLSPNVPNAGADLSVNLGQITILPALASPNPNEINTPQPLDITLNNGLQLIGADAMAITDSVLQPGSQITLKLWTAATEPIEENVAVLVRLTKGEKAWPLNEDLQLLGGKMYSTKKWPVNSPIQTFVDGRVPAELENGNYNLGLRLLNVDTGELIIDIPLGLVQVEGRTRNFEVPSLKNQLHTNYNNQISLLGYDLDMSRVETEGVVRLILYWQAQKDIGESYKVFVHFLDEENQIVAQIDREPQTGLAPTSGWLLGEVVTDVIELPVSKGMESVARISVGLYSPATGQRLQTGGNSGEATDSNTIIPLK